MRARATVSLATATAPELCGDGRRHRHHSPAACCSTIYTQPRHTHNTYVYANT